MWHEFIKYTFNIIRDGGSDSELRAYVHGNGEMRLSDFMEFNVMKMLLYGDTYDESYDTRLIESRFAGPLMVYWAMSLLTSKYKGGVGVSDEDPLYRIVYFVYLRKCNKTGQLVDWSQTRPYETLDRDFFTYDWVCANHGHTYEAVQTIAISWIRAAIAARCIQRRWRSRRAAAIVIKKALRRALANPNYTMCKTRLIRECMQMHASF